MADSYFSRLSQEALDSLASMEGLDSVEPVRGIELPASSSQAKPVSSPWLGYLAASTVAAAAYGIYVFLPACKRGDPGNSGWRDNAQSRGFPSGDSRQLQGVGAAGDSGHHRIDRRDAHLADVARGVPYLAVIGAAIAVGFYAAVWAGRLLGASRNTALLVGAGTAICGTSAIVAVAPVVDADHDDLLLSVSTINVLGLLVMLALPVLGGWSGMPVDRFGAWAGCGSTGMTTGFAFGEQAGAIATLVKLVRVTLLAPFIVFVALTFATRKVRMKVQVSKLLPPFIYALRLWRC